jgi:hypothetical protein
MHAEGRPERRSERKEKELGKRTSHQLSLSYSTMKYYFNECWVF